MTRMSARLRARARLRRLTCGRSLPERWVRRLEPALRPRSASVGGAAAGFVLLGPAGAALGAVAGEAARAARGRREATARTRRFEEQIPDALRSMAAALRAGQSLAQALASAHEEAAPPMRDALGTALARLAAGTPMDEALAALERACPAPSAPIALGAIRVGRASGGNLPVILDATADAAAERRRLAAARRAATAQARLSAWVVAAMPVAFFVLLGAGAREQLRAALSEPAGWALLAAGTILEATGILWVRRLVEAPG